MTTPIREMEAAHAELQARFDALGTQYNALADEHKRLAAQIARDEGGAGRAATKDRLEWLAQEGDRLTRERQILADRMGTVMATLIPARQALKEAKRNLEYLSSAGPNDDAVVRLGVGQIRQAQKQLKQLINQLEA